MTVEETKLQILGELELARSRTERLINSLSDTQLDAPYHPGVNPPLWEMGHSAFFYEVFVFKLLDGTVSYNPAMDDLWDSFHVQHRDRWRRDLFPGREDTLQYFNTVYDRVAERIRRYELTDQALYLYRYAIFHQNMHIESLIWCRQTVGYPAPPDFQGDRPAPGEGVAGDVEVPAGRWVMGMPDASEAFAAEDFAFDAEKPRFEVELPGFVISRLLVTNREFQAFVDDSGYQRPELWSFGGRQWLASAAEHPVYWRCHEGQWQARLFDRWLPLNPDAPVTHVSYWEAEAWCRWAGRRLPTEYEWEVAALGNRPGEVFQRYPWGNEAPDGSRVDMNGRSMAWNPVFDYPAGESPFGCRQMLGSVWEWTSDQFLPYDGFKVDIYPFMSTLQFGDHKVTRGGSCATTSSLIRGTYRQAYLPQRSDVFTGFRTCALR
ncbi:selenoneine synthase SenA [Marinobacter sp.]|uniref:selenoneine synthase SenA n=1 Tax=Marinobacter sp. TaxID=50741 RepID=UPI003A5C1878